MGRSVSVPVNAELVAYQDWSDIRDSLDYDIRIEDIQRMLCDMWPSVELERGWLGREDRIIAGNCLATFGVSEYCGLAAIWAVPDDDDLAALAAGWLARIEPRFNRTFGQLQRLGTASNGEVFFKKVNL